jgi:transcription elongation factor GreA
MQFITDQDRQQLQAKLDQLIGRRPQITQRIAEARAMGDLSENAEYHAAREEQGLNEAEIRRIEERLKTAKVVNHDQVPDDMVFLGATVRLIEIDDDGEQVDDDLYHLVGEASGGLDADFVEVTAQSPLGEAMTKARIGETIKVDLPRGTKRYRVAEIL